MQPLSHLHPRAETGMRAASSGCPSSWHPGTAASVQPPAWLSFGFPWGGSEYVLLLSHWLPEGRLWRGRGRRREVSQKEHSRLSASSGNILKSHQRVCLPCSTVAVLPAKTALDAIEHYYSKTQSSPGPWVIPKCCCSSELWWWEWLGKVPEGAAAKQSSRCEQAEILRWMCPCAGPLP